jgi:TPR repeat protein
MAQEPDVDEPKIPAHMSECEGKDNATCGTWTFTGSEGLGNWRHGAIAELTVQQFDPGWVIIRRSDSSGISQGLTAVYLGKIVENRVEGTVTWTWPGHWNNKPSKGTWFATFDDPQSTSPASRPKESEAQASQSSQGDLKPAPVRRPQEIEGSESPSHEVLTDKSSPTLAARDLQTGTDAEALVKRADQLYDKRDYAAALPLYQKAAAAGQPHALMRVGFCYDLGYGVKSDPAAALHWYQKAVKAGDLEAMAYLGGLYADGTGVSPDYDKAMALFRRSAEGGEPAGMNKIGLMYAAGHGVPRNLAEAVRWYLKAADLGYTWAMINLGKAYDAGAGVPENEPEALRMLRKAADLGNDEAMTVLGEIYAHGGFGVPRDLNESAAWHRKAAALGNDTARKLLARVGRPIFDLNGDWEGYYLFQGLPEAIRIVQDGDSITATRLRPSDLSLMGPFFRGRRVGDLRKGEIEIAEYSVVGMLFSALKGISPLGSLGVPGAWEPETLYIENPDRIHIGKTSEFQRISAPRPDDLYCDLGNPLKVEAEYAFARGQIAVETKSYDTAACWFHVGITQGSARSRAGMGDLLRYGLGVSKNPLWARGWFDNSAASGDPYGAQSIADMYDRGELAPDAEQSSFWHTKAREMKMQQDKLIAELKKQEKKAQAEMRLLAGATIVGMQFLVNDLGSDPECDVRQVTENGITIPNSVSPVRERNRERLLASGKIYCGRPIDLSPLLEAIR